ncbi:MAG: hypothetical protein M1609_09230 [Firmicutes bacterium]|nr:hypothetical protein [Bacillota bacterium]
MQCEALEKVISIARKNPKILLGPAFFEKICARLDIEATQTPDRMNFRFDSREAAAVIINPENCKQFKCFVREGKNGIMIYEFVNILVALLTDEKIPPSPHEKLGPTAAYYCKRGIEILERNLLTE